MLKIRLAYLGALFLVSSFIAQQTLAESASVTTNTVTARHRQNTAFIDKTISSEKHRNKQAEARRHSRHLQKKMSRISWVAHKKISRVIISGNKTMSTSEIDFIIAPYLKGGVTKRELRLISDNIENYYRKRGYFLPVAHASISGSSLKVKIIEGKIKNVFIMLDNEKRDKKALKNKRFLDLIAKIEDADPVKTKDLERYLLLISKIHGYKVEYDIEPLANIKGNNVADLVIETQTKRGSAEISFDNKGTSDLGKHQINFSSQIFNPFSNDSLMLDIGTSDKPKRYQMISGGYLKRLNSYGTSASIFAAYSQDDPHIGGSGKDSKSTIVKGRVDQYVVLNNDNSVKLEIAAENRDIENYFQKTKTRDYHYMMGSVGGKIKITDPLNVENWFFPYYNWTLNNVSYSNNTELKRNFDKNFNYFVIDWYRNQFLPKDFSLFLKASYQLTSKILPIEHIYSVGTSRTGRGYKVGLVSGDEGISGTAELIYTKKFDNYKISRFLETGQIFGFYDVTHFVKHNKDATRKHHPDAIYFDKSTLPGIGFGLRLYFPYEIYAEGTAEYPIVRNITIDGIKEKNKPLYRFLLSKEFKW